jgi:peptide chain release factor 1
MNYLDKLKAIHDKWLEITEKLTDPDLMSDMKNYIRLNKEYKDLEPIVDAYKEYKSTLENLESAKSILATEKDEDFREMAKEELDAMQEKKDELEEEIRILLLPQDPQDSKNAI